MKNTKLRYVLLPILGLSFLVGGITYASAETNGRGNPFGNLAEAIAAKFNVPIADVQTVINDTVAANRAEMAKNRPGRVDMLAQAVKDGKLTQAQADLITAKRTELRNAVGSVKDLSVTERASLMKEHQAALKEWATANNIPEEYVFGFGGGMRRGGGMPFGRGNAPA